MEFSSYKKPPNKADASHAMIFSRDLDLKTTVWK